MRWIKRIIAAGGVVLILGISLYFSIEWYIFAHTPLTQSEVTRNIIIPRGMGARQLAWYLYRQRLIRKPHLFIALIYINGDSRRLQAGEYAITPATTPLGLLAAIVSGKIVQHTFTIVEGWTFKELLVALMGNNELDHKLNKLTNTQIMAKLGHPEQHPEGLFFPDTYFFKLGDSDFGILQQAYRKMYNTLTEQWKSRAPNLSYKSAYQALIVASLIEVETSLDGERAVIAGVILNRLQKNMLLQIDPTVMYGLNKGYGSELSKQDLRTPTRYNTYLNKGLPPTPIDLPGEASIIAAMHPVLSDYFFYVSRGDGSHQFSTTYAEHVSAVHKYLLKDHQP